MLQLPPLDRQPPAARPHLDRMIQALRTTRAMLTELAEAFLVGAVLGDGSLCRWILSYA